MTTPFRRLGRAAYAVVALALVATLVLPSLTHLASAAQVTSRSIKISDATTSATGVSYLVSFVPQTSTNIGGIVVDFCADSPLVGDTACSDPSGFTMGATPSVSAPSGFSTSTGSWVTTNSLQCDAAAGQTQTLLLTNATAQTPSAVGTTPITFTISGVTNTSTLGTFYARILTFAADTDATGDYTCATANARPSSYPNMKDYGGVALTTVTTINITAKVMEQITFCTTAWNGLDQTQGSGNDCSNVNVGTNLPNLTIGHGSTTKAIDATAVDAKTAYTQLSTNANGGAIVRMKTTSSTACGGLSRNGGTSCGDIPAVGATAAAITKGTAAFGMCVVPGGTSITADAPYDSASCAATDTPAMTGNSTTAAYGLDDTTANNNVVALYGSQIFHTTTQVNQSVVPLNFAATAGLTTPAGIYTTAESLIATGTF